MRVLEDRLFCRENNVDMHYLEVAGDSTEVVNLPTVGVVDGSYFLATDTAEVYFFNENSGEWKVA